MKNLKQMGLDERATLAYTYGVYYQQYQSGKVSDDGWNVTSTIDYIEHTFSDAALTDDGEAHFALEQAHSNE